MSFVQMLNVLTLLINRIFVAFKRLTSWKHVLPISATKKTCPNSFGVDAVDGKALTSDDPVNEDHARALQQIETYLYVHNRLFLVLSDKGPSSVVSKHISDLHYHVVPLFASHINEIIHREAEQHPSGEFRFTTPRLKDILEFDQMACALEKKNPVTKIVYQAGSDRITQSTLSFLVGCHMMISHGLGYEETYLAFGSIRHLLEPSSFDQPSISVKSCLRAFCRAKCSDWITFKEQTDDSPEKPGSIHIDEYLHYARSPPTPRVTNRLYLASRSAS
jgi:hypothetical protein